jgi:hypothetical protein
MPNRVRPRHHGRAMEPVFRKGPSGNAFVRVPDLFVCAERGCPAVEKGRPGAK